MQYKKILYPFFLSFFSISLSYISCKVPTPNQDNNNTNDVDKINDESVNTNNEPSTEITCEQNGPSWFFSSYNTNSDIPLIWSKDKDGSEPYFYMLKKQNNLFDKISVKSQDDLLFGEAAPSIASSNLNDIYIFGGVNYSENDKINSFKNGILKISNSSSHENIFTNSLSVDGSIGHKEIDKRSNACLLYYDINNNIDNSYLFLFGGKNDHDFALGDGLLIDLTKKQHMFFGNDIDKYTNNIVSDWPTPRNSHICSLRQDISRNSTNIYIAGGITDKESSLTDLWNVRVDHSEGSPSISSRLILKDSQRNQSCIAINDSYYVIYGGFSKDNHRTLNDGLIVRLKDDKVSYFKINSLEGSEIGCIANDFSGGNDNIAISKSLGLLINIGKNKLTNIKNIVIDDFFNTTTSPENPYIAIGDMYDGPIFDECIGRKLLPYKKIHDNSVESGFISLGREDGKYIIIKKTFKK